MKPILKDLNGILFLSFSFVPYYLLFCDRITSVNWFFHVHAPIIYNSYTHKLYKHNIWLMVFWRYTPKKKRKEKKRKEKKKKKWGTLRKGVVHTNGSFICFCSHGNVQYPLLFFFLVIDIKLVDNSSVDSLVSWEKKKKKKERSFFLFFLCLFSSLSPLPGKKFLLPKVIPKLQHLLCCFLHRIITIKYQNKK